MFDLKKEYFCLFGLDMFYVKNLSFFCLFCRYIDEKLILVILGLCIVEVRDVVFLL